MKKFALFLFLILAFAAVGSGQTLQTCTANPRYFCKDGVPVYLTGSHTWTNLMDAGTPYDFEAYLDFLQAKNHTFLRLWAWEVTNSLDDIGFLPIISDFPWLRTGSGLANDGLPKFDLTQQNPLFFQRLRNRVIDARARGFYVGIMFFEGWGLAVNASRFVNHPFSVANNINGIAETQATVHTLTNPVTTAIQQAYIHAVIDAVNDLDNVIYEIANESRPTAANTAWQYHWIDDIRSYETMKPYQHPVGMTWQREAEFGFGNAPLWASSADWISPGDPDGEPYDDNPPAATGAKVVISDTDHIFGDPGGSAIWVWKTFLRGMNPILMDGGIVTFPASNDGRESARNGMGQTKLYADTINLLETAPQNSRASSGYALCSTFRCAVLAFPRNGNKAATVSVTMPAGTYQVDWLDPDTGVITHSANVNHSGGARTYTAPVKRETLVLMLREASSQAASIDQPRQRGKKK